MAGTLYLCATPIGNLDDMTLRVLKLLETADIIAAEDTRNTLKLLNHFEIKTPMTSYHEHNKAEKGPKLVERLLVGENIALVTDAGMPGISDPGADLVKLCYEAGVPVTVAPGASAAVVALVLSGLDTRRFQALSGSQIILAAVIAFVIWAIIEFIRSVKVVKKTFGEVDMARVMERCHELFPIETILFRGAEFQRGMRIRITTTQKTIIEGELIGMNKIQMICIRTKNQIIAHQLDKIQEMTKI